jgi:U4/U6 small nuclear ribonucleoprotein PRP3
MERRDRKHSRDEDTKYNDSSKKRKSSDGVRLILSSNADEKASLSDSKRSTADDIADAKARIANMMKKRNLDVAPSSTSTHSKAIEERIAAAKARIAAKSQVFEQNIQSLAKAEEDASKAKGGLAVNVHPSLLADLPTKVDRRNQYIAPKFSTTLANLNRQTEVVTRHLQNREKAEEKEKKLEILTKPAESDFSTDNPYFDPKLDTAYSVQKDRKTRPIMFNPHGKYIEKAKAERAAAKMEELKRKIEERAKKAGLEEDLDVGDREVLLRPAPPEIEWWDEDFLANKTYDDIDNGNIILDGDNTKITLYIQHPIPIPPPSTTHAPPSRPVMMTAKEMAKARRLRRAEDQKDKRGKILLGLMPPDPPKIKMANLMKVLTSEAVKDPTAVERRVRREIDNRKNKHEQENEARKLTKEERHAKDSEKRNTDVLRTGLHCCLFRIANLSNPSHRFKVNKTAQQLELTGIVILNPRTNIVIVEGGLPAIKKYKRLLLVRTDWTDNARNATIRKGNLEMLKDQPEPEDLSGNTCELVWEGELKARNFKIWVGEREAVNDAAARKWLGKGAENYWRLAVRSGES